MIDTITGSAQSIAAIVVLLGACVFFHEAGHFILAKVSGMLVHEFSIGFGPSLLGYRVGETLYSIRAIPLGGYVRIAGMELEDRDVERGFYTFPRWQGFTVLLAGSVMNVVLAALVFIVIATVNGLPVFPDYTVRVLKVLPASAAESAGLQSGDEVTGVDGITHGLFVEDLHPRGLASQAGLIPTDLIYEVADQEVSVPAELLAAFRDSTGESVKLEVARYSADGSITDVPELDMPVPKQFAGEQVLQVEPEPEIRDGVTVAPLREILDHVGGVLYWLPSEERVRVVTAATDTYLRIGDPTARVNNETRELEVAPYVKRGRTMVPLQLIAEVVGMTISYDPESRQIHIAGEAPTDLEAVDVVEEALGLTLAPLDRVAMVGYISERPEKQVALTVNREGRELEVKVTPRAEWARVATKDAQGRLSSAHEKVGRIGVVLTGAREKVGVTRATVHGVKRSYEAIGVVVYGFREMLRGKLAPEASGPIGIMAMTAERAKMGWAAVAGLLGIISANLAVINLFPIPPFDGFRIVVLGIEAVIRRRIDAKKELAVTIAGIALILGLFLVITFKDILNLIVYNTP